MGKLDIQPGQLFLDIGCGSGAVSAAAVAIQTGSMASIGERRQWQCPEPGFQQENSLPGKRRSLCRPAGVGPLLHRRDARIDEFWPLLLEKAGSGCIIVADLARLA